jgi:rhodanese-related sulfurtransferase
MATITWDERWATIERGDAFTLVEALPADVYRDRHLPGAMNRPFESDDEILARARERLPDERAVIVVDCMSTIGPASAIVARELAAHGSTRGREDAEGKQDWIHAGRPTAGAPVPGALPPHEGSRRWRERGWDRPSLGSGSGWLRPAPGA